RASSDSGCPSEASGKEAIMVRRTTGFVCSLVLSLAVLPLDASSGEQPPPRRPQPTPTVAPARLDRSILDAIPLRLIGPSAPSGRVWNVVGVAGKPKTFYACTAEGGVFRTTNNGTTMTPIFDEENAAVCGAVAIAPSDPNQIWVGSG